MNDKEAQKSHQEELGSDKTEFKREIGLFGGVSILAGIMIGGGIFYLGSYVMMRTGYSLGMCLLAWVIGGVVCMLGGLCYAELGAMMPKAGGRIVYLSEAYHPIVGFASGFTQWFLSESGSIAAGALALMAMFSLEGVTAKIIASVVVIVFAGINMLGVKKGSMVTNVMVVAKIVPILIILVAALIQGHSGNTISMKPMDGEAKGSFIHMIAFAVVATLYAYDGWIDLNTVAEEIKNPQRNLPLSIILGIGSITVLYCLFNFAIWKVIPMNEMHELIESGNYYLGTEVARRIFGSAGVVLVSVGMAISQLGAINSMVLTYPRVGYAMGHEGHFFKFVGKLNRNSVPANATIVLIAVVLVMIWARSLDQVVDMVIFVGQITNVLVIFAVILLRKKMPDMPRPYKVWGGYVTVILAVLANLYLMYNTLMNDSTTAISGLIFWVLGVIVYAFFEMKNKKEAQKLSGENS